MEEVYSWTKIADDFRDGLILGNGASIAFDSRFNYPSLHERAKELELIADDVHLVFEHLKTKDFELVLRMLWHASKINMALKIPDDDRTTKAYHSVRDALIEVVREIHVPYGEVRSNLAIAADFMSRFGKVISLSYDVLVYWAFMVGNEGTPNRFKDCFLKGKFQHDWEWLKKPFRNNPNTTLVFYPHGNLALAADLVGSEEKIEAYIGADLLNSIIERWMSGNYVPIFVSEGTSEKKLSAILRSQYLSTVYYEVLPQLGESIVVFGWSIGDQDQDNHLLNAICQKEKTRRFAVSVDPKDSRLSEIQATVRRKLNERPGRNKFELMFFDRGSCGCWITP